MGRYWDAFPEALRERYGRDFKSGFDRIKNLYRDVGFGKVAGTGKDPLTVDHVMAIFEEDLPFVEDWTKPELKCLAERMESKGAAKLIVALGRIQLPMTADDRRHHLDLLRKIIYCFRELTPTALVLQHVYPERFAMCSHHLASQLYIAAPTVPEFYAKYCEELRAWSERQWPTSRKLTVVEAEYALWTWYRLAYHGRDGAQRRKIQREFSKDRWVQERRAKQIADSLGSVGKLDLARSFLDTDPTVAAIIAWRELETKVREMTGCYEIIGMPKLIDKLRIDDRAKSDLKGLWFWRGAEGEAGRNPTMHEGAELLDEGEAKRVLDGVVKFINLS